MAKVFTVSEINKYASRLIKNDLILGRNVEVEGEIGEVSFSQAGHAYFVLKDAACQIKVNFFKNYRDKSEVTLKPGVSVLCVGKINLYETTGSYSLTASVVKESGLGRMYENYIKLKEKLEREGLFALERKKSIPKYPSVVGVVTSAEGAVIHDIITTVKKRSPGVSIALAPAFVQGEAAPSSMIEALRLLREYGGIDVVIIGRGGGSFEDLNCFNDESLVREIVSYDIPIISAVGHETNVTLTDLAADMRAATPTAAAQAAVPDVESILKFYSQKIAFAQSLVEKKMHILKSSLKAKAQLLRAMHPENRLRQRQMLIDMLYERLENSIGRLFSSFRDKLNIYEARLSGRNPKNALRKGYAYISDKTGTIITSANKFNLGDKVFMTLYDGIIEGTVDKISPLDKNKL